MHEVPAAEEDAAMETQETGGYQTSNSHTVVYAKEVEGWDSRPSE